MLLAGSFLVYQVHSGGVAGGGAGGTVGTKGGSSQTEFKLFCHRTGCRLALNDNHTVILCRGTLEQAGKETRQGRREREEQRIVGILAKAPNFPKILRTTGKQPIHTPLTSPSREPSNWTMTYVQVMNWQGIELIGQH